MQQFTDKYIGTLESGRLMEGGRLIGGRLIEVGLYVHPKIAIMFDHSRSGLENNFFPNKITQAPTTLIL